MVRRLMFPMLGLGVSLGCISCALKAHPVAEPKVEPVTKTLKSTVPEPEQPKPMPAQVDDGIRLPGNLLALPKDEELKSNKPSGQRTSEGVISRPPVEKKD